MSGRLRKKIATATPASSAVTPRRDFLVTGKPKAVAEFAFDWLGLKPDKRFREATLEAVANVLISDEWRVDATEPEARTYGQLRQRLRKQAHGVQKGWLPAWERKPRGPLSVPTRLPGGVLV